MSLRLLVGCLLVLACGSGSGRPQSDAGDTDAGAPDAGNLDAGGLDAGDSDGGNLDGGSPDAATTCRNGLCQTDAEVCSSDAGVFTYPRPSPLPEMLAACDGGCAAIADSSVEGARIDGHWSFEEPRPFSLPLRSAWLSDGGELWAATAIDPITPQATPLVVHWDRTSWTVEPAPPAASLWGHPQGTLWAAGPSGIFARLSGGWALQHAGNYLTVDGTAPDDIWAVGGAVVSHFDGAQWSDQTLPSPHGSLRLSLVMAFARDDVWVWGGGFIGPNCGGSQCVGLFPDDRTVGFHFDGASWTYATVGPFCFATNPGPVMFNRLSISPPFQLAPIGPPVYWDGAAWSLLNGFDMTLGASSIDPMFQGRFWRRGPNDFVAPFAAFESSAGGSLRRFDGVKWNVEQIASTSYIAFQGTDHAWAVGDDLLEYAAGAWTEHKQSTSVKASVISRSPSGGLFAAGRGTASRTVALLQRDEPSRHWTEIASAPLPQSVQQQPFAIQPLGPDDIWLLAPQAILHWDGQTLSLPVDAPNMNPVSIWAASQDELWVGGRAGTGRATLARWNRQSGWTMFDTAGFDILQVNGTGPNDVWAAENDPTLTLKAALRHWDGAAWTRVQPFPSNTWEGVASLSPTNVFATGPQGTTQGDGVSSWTRFTGPSGQLQVFQSGVVGDRLQAWFDGGPQNVAPTILNPTIDSFVIAPDGTISASTSLGILRRDP